MSEKSEDLKGLMPTERKSTWRTAEERRMSDLTWVLQWQERRQGKKKPPFQVLSKKNRREDLRQLHQGETELNFQKTKGKS